MTTTPEDTGLKPCECGCGAMVKGRFKRGHYLRDAKNRLTQLPGPDDDLDGDDIIDAEPQRPGDLSHLSQADREAFADAIRDNAEQPEPEIPADRPPGRLRERPAGGGRGGRAARGKTRVTAADRTDVRAKINFVLEPAGKIWQIRDPYCGGVFVEQRPDITDALVNIVCDSPDLLAWFSGAAGGYMKYFALAMACQPVAMMVLAHASWRPPAGTPPGVKVPHPHRVVPPGYDGAQPPQMPAYAA